MTIALQPQLAAHLHRHARKLHRMACGFGRSRDADDILQTLYVRWWRRMREEAGWSPPESTVELFVCVRRASMDVVAKEQRMRAHTDEAPAPTVWADSAEESLFAFERLQWILSRLPTPLADALKASLSAGRNADAAVARELGLTTATFTTRLFKARRAAEELATYYELLPLDHAELLAELRFGGKTRHQVAHERGMMPDELLAVCQEAAETLEKSRKVAV